MQRSAGPSSLLPAVVVPHPEVVTERQNHAKLLDCWGTEVLHRHSFLVVLFSDIPRSCVTFFFFYTGKNCEDSLLPN